MARRAAWIDGRYGPVEEARISVLDLGVTRSDCTYDVVHVWDGRFFRLEAHLDRFAASLARLRLDPGYDRAQIEAILHGCVRHADLVRIPPASVDPRIKNYHWLDLDLALLEAYDHGADLVLLRDLSQEDLRRAAEVLVTSTAGGIMPVTVIDGQPVGTG